MRTLIIAALLLVSLPSFAEFHPGTIVNKNGRSRKGFIEASLGEVVRFKPWMEAEEETISPQNIKSIQIRTDSGRVIREYYYIQVSASGKKATTHATWLRLLEKGTVSLYVQETVSHRNGTDMFQSEDFYCIREGQDSAKPVASYDSNHTFKAKAPLYFADCPQLVERIKSKQYSWQNIQEVVQFYNLWLANNKLQKNA